MNVKSIFFLIFLIVLISLVGCSSDSSSTETTSNQSNQNQSDDTQEEDLPDKVTIAYQTVPHPIYYAADQGWFEEEMGVTVEFREFSKGQDINAAMLSGSVDIGSLGTSAASTGISQGVGYTVFMLANTDTSEVIVGRESAGVNSLEDLVGKTVATPFGSNGHFRLMEALKAEGIDANSIDIVNMTPGNMAAAWEREDIDAASAWNPVITNMVASGGQIILDVEQMEDMGIQAVDVYVSSKEFTEKYPHLVTKFAKVANRAIEFYFASDENKEKVYASVTDWMALEKDQLVEAMGDMKYIAIDDQLTETLFGSSEVPGDLAHIFKTNSDFLKEAQFTEESPSLETFLELISSKYMEEAK